MSSYTITLEPPLYEALRAAAQQRSTTVEDVIAGATELFLKQQDADLDDWTPEDIEAVEVGMAQLRRGEGVPQEEVMSRLRAKHGW